MIRFHFKLNKTLQALGLLMKDKGYSDQSTYLKLIKLLYIADRESISETGQPITGDRLVAMQQGPVLSGLYHIIRHQGSSPEWKRWFHASLSDKTIEMRADPGTDLLCRYEIDKLREVSKRHRNDNRWRLRDITHDFPEWKNHNPGRSSRPIPVEDLLEAVGRSGDRASIEQDAKAQCQFARVFEG